MISHISWIANTVKDHDLGYGLLLTSVFEHFEIPLQKKVRLHATDEIGNSTLLECGFKITKCGAASSEQGQQTPFAPVSGSSITGPSLDTLVYDQTCLKEKLSEAKQALPKEKALNAKFHEDLLHAISALMAKLSISPP